MAAEMSLDGAVVGREDADAFTECSWHCFAHHWLIELRRPLKRVLVLNLYVHSRPQILS